MRPLRLLLAVVLIVAAGALAGCGNLLAAGGGLTCVVADDGTPTCFGADGAGQAGRAPAATATPGPVTLPKGYGAADVSVGSGAPDGQSTACAAVGRAGSASGGSVRCWGSDAYGQLGRGSAGAASATPVRVDLGDDRDASSVAVGGTFACAIAGSDGISCWGANGNGQLGTAPSGIAGPAIVTGTASFKGSDGTTSSPTLLAAGRAHVCAGIAAKIACWGAGTAGQLGNGASADSATPVAVALPKSVGGVGQIAAGWESTCVVASDAAAPGTQRVWCWGGNGSGQLGDGTATASAVPVKAAIPATQEAAQVSVGADHACAVMQDHSAWCWGANASGQLGDGTTTASSTPVQVKGLKAVLIAAGAGHTCASTTAGRLVCWGTNAQGQLGTAPGDLSTAPRTVPGIDGLRTPIGKAVRITGTRAVGATLTAVTGSWRYAERYAYRWERRCGDGEWKDVEGAKRKTLKVAAGLAGCSVRATVNGDNAWTQAGVATSAYRTSPSAAIPG